MTPSSPPIQPASHSVDCAQISENKKRDLKADSDSNIEEINAIKVDILDIKTKLNSLLPRTPDIATLDAPPDPPAGPVPANVAAHNHATHASEPDGAGPNHAANTAAPDVSVTAESKDGISVVAEVYANNDSDIMIASIDEDISDEEVAENQQNPSTLPTNQLN